MMLISTWIESPLPPPPPKKRKRKSKKIVPPSFTKFIRKVFSVLREESKESFREYSLYNRGK